ncbi:unnamed protein product [Rhizoctonia solani]|uniref:BTB domain-containing protein n=1 Tax=Rhizoctonia solani TaxID=456999 RepID=A0A8H3DDV5_9AGAM|nr:unnamed protein product [Rhizoctonia solani]
MSIMLENLPADYPPISVSSRFNLDSWDLQDADVLFLTPDQVFFYAHRAVLLRYSSNFFGGLLADDTMHDAHEEIDVSQPMSDSDSDLSLEPRLVTVNFPADILNVILLALYQLRIKDFAPSSETLRQVIPTLVILGYDPSVIAYPGSELYALLLKSANTDPLPMYAAAAQCSFESLAVAVSAMTLRTQLHEITDELSQQMGPVYMRRLFCTFNNSTSSFCN